MKLTTILEAIEVKESAGLAMYTDDGKVFLVQPFGMKGSRNFGLPKGIIDKGENVLEAAKREFYEETQIKVPRDAEFIDLGVETMKYKDTTKNLRIFAFKGTGNEKFKGSNLIDSGPRKGMPEIVRGFYFTFKDAEKRIHEYQRPFIGKLMGLVS